MCFNCSCSFLYMCSKKSEQFGWRFGKVRIISIFKTLQCEQTPLCSDRVAEQVTALFVAPFCWERKGERSNESGCLWLAICPLRWGLPGRTCLPGRKTSEGMRFKNTLTAAELSFQPEFLPHVLDYGFFCIGNIHLSRYIWISDFFKINNVFFLMILDHSYLLGDELTPTTIFLGM